MAFSKQNDDEKSPISNIFLISFQRNMTLKVLHKKKLNKEKKTRRRMENTYDFYQSDF